MTDPGELRDRVQALPWYHSIDLGQGVVTPGDSKTVPLSGSQLPEFTGRSALDIGAWDGYYSFLAEREGASRVVALDHYAWGVDYAARDAYWEECRERDELPDPRRDLTDFWRPHLLHGKRSFDLAHEVLKSNVEPVVGDFMTMDLSTLGSFDIVVFLGVLYHLEEPLTALRRVRALTKGVAVIETEVVDVRGYPDDNLLVFFDDDTWGRDFTNWYAPTLPALRSMCRAAGFDRVEVKRSAEPTRRTRRRQRISHRRVVVHAFAEPT